MDNEEKRKKIKIKLKNSSIPANVLYTGQQMILVHRAIQILRKYAQVDHYILSAGFGLVGENEKLPSYDATFTGLSKSKIEVLSDNLNINQSIADLRFPYDLIYLALGKEYQYSILPFIKSEYGTEIICFSRDHQIGSNFTQITENKIIGKKDSVYLPVGIGATVNAKGGILLNFAYWMEHSSQDPYPLIFSEYWEKLSQKY